MMSRYYVTKIGDIFYIIRPSFTTGKNVSYGVVNGSWIFYLRLNICFNCKYLCLYFKYLLS